MSITELGCQVAMRREDLRIATKHRRLAEGRTMSPPNRRAYISALEWEGECRVRFQNAGAALIAAQAPVAA